MTGKWSEGVQHRIDTSCRDDRGAFGDGGPSICWSCSESESSAPSSPPSSSAPCWLGPRLMKVPVSFPHHSRSGVQDWTNRPARMRDVAGVFTEFQSPRRMRLPLGGRMYTLTTKSWRFPLKRISQPASRPG
eukprot:tig00021123_g18501.t1